MKLLIFLKKQKYYQKYSVRFKANIINLAIKDNLIHLIMPFPLQNAYQKLFGKYSITPKGEIRTEHKFQNQYIYWTKDLKPKEEKTFELKFKVSVESRNKPLKDNADLSRFLKSDQFINAREVLKISNDLTKKIDDPDEKVKILNDYVVNNLQYGNPIKGLYTISQALKNDKVDCGGFDTLLASLCMAQKIPARIISGFFANENNKMHAWVEIYLPNRGWVVADPSMEKLSKERRSKRWAKLGNISADRIALSLGQNFKLKLPGKILKLDILQNPQIIAQWGESSIKFKTEFMAKKI